MKIITSLILGFILLFGSCSLLEENCICTQEFRMYTVFVIDNSNKPVDSLDVEIKNARTGKYYLFLEKIYLGKGVYQVMNDGYTKEFTEEPELIVFKGSKFGVTVESDYLFNTDRCKCHVQKLLGKDTLKINL